MNSTSMIPTACVHSFHRDIAKNPAYWSMVCLYNIAKLAKEATTVRRVLEPLFHQFDKENHWSSEKGVGYCVLMYLQSLLAESGILVASRVIIFYRYKIFPIFLNSRLSLLNTRK